MSNLQDRQPRCCSEAASNRVAGFTCLPNWLFGQATAQELVVLLALQHHAPNIHPSLATLARVSGLGKSTVCRILVGLKERGWLWTERRVADGGANNSTSYHLLIWAIEQPSAIVPERDNLSRSGGGTVPERDTKKMNLRIKTKPTALEPPLPPASQGELRPPAVAARPYRDRDGFLIADPESKPEAVAQPPVTPEPPSRPRVEVQPQPQQPNPPRPLPNPPDPEAIAPVKPKARKREAGFTPTVDDVPAALLPVHRELLAFWPARNPKGKRTERAWGAMLTDAQKIQGHQQGGTEILRQQLEQGAAASVTGAGWQGLSFANWLRYGAKATTPVMGTGFAGKRTTMDRVMGAIALVEERERKAAAAQQAERSGLVLAEVA